MESFHRNPYSNYAFENIIKMLSSGTVQVHVCNSDEYLLTSKNFTDSEFRRKRNRATS